MLTFQALQSLNNAKLAQLLHESVPDLRKEPRSALKDKIRDRVVEHGFTGEHVLGCLQEASKPGKTMKETEFFKKLFNDTDDDFRNALTVARSSTIFSHTLLMKLALANASPAVRAVEGAIIDPKIIPAEYRAMEFDAFYPEKQSWLIKCGMERHVIYSATIGRPGENRRGVHGFSMAPAGWLRLGIKVDSALLDMSSWHKAYHGTSVKNVPPIIDKGLVRPQKSLHGSVGSAGKKVIYCSPSIEYSAHWIYTSYQGDGAQAPADAKGYGGALTGMAESEGLPVIEKEGQHAQYVFEVRVNPDAYRVQGNTLGSKVWSDKQLEFDPLVSSRNLEWIVEDEKDIVVTGIMVRVLPDKLTPKQFSLEREKGMKDHVKWQEGRPTRDRKYGGVETCEVQSVVWEWNSALSKTLSHSDSVPWVAYPDEICEVIESAYQDYQQFVFIGQPGDADGPLMIDFGSEGDAKLTNRMPEQRRADSDKEQEWRRRAVRRRKRQAV